ncbi:MAG: hypothetical protein KIT87_06155 [Anaerolineae bacterium]|nr:hypothetical protein [Anaerolineae bacterium]
MSGRLAAWPTLTRPARFVRRFLWIVGAALLLQGGVSLVVRALAVPLPDLALAFVNADSLHAVIHITWGLIMLGAVARIAHDTALARLVLTFGVFYTLLAFLGVLVHHPFGLKLDLGENVFHFTVGPLALLVGLWGVRGRRP